MKDRVHATVCLAEDQILSAETISALNDLAIAGAQILIRRAPGRHQAESTVRVARGIAAHRRDGEWRVTVGGDQIPHGFPSAEEAVEYARKTRCVR